MNLLVDTHVLLWWMADDPALPGRARDAIAAPEHRAFVSAASAWEIAIKRALGKLDAPDDLHDALVAGGFDELAVTVQHATAAGALPRHHDDPFDRMLIAQARLHDLTIVTVDERMVRYDVAVLTLG